MSDISKQMNCYILAGGKSSRMGEDKGLLELNGKTIMEYVIAQVKPLFKTVFIVSSNEQYSRFGLEVIPDLVKDIGPAGGILTVIQHSSTEHNLVISCDMPFITSEALEYLTAGAKAYQVVVPIHQQKLEPLCAIYSRSCLDLWKQEIEKGVYKLQNIISNFKTQELNVEEHPLFQSDFFTNINTKEDLEKAIKKLDHGN